ncbi:MAG TPA: PqqD family peptide modification chaperone [Ignavibacteriaceae bacterium]|nr:PqqD family peptide modification chaperone [Ignavibacteriaceae bacterium]
MLEYYHTLESQYISLSGSPSLHYYPDYTVLNILTPQSRYIHLFLNLTATEIIEICDGTAKVEDIIKDFANKYKAPFQKAQTSVWNIINHGLEFNYLHLSERLKKNKITTTGSTAYYIPQNLSIEITSRCNEKCAHCYGDFNPQNYTNWEISNLKKTITDFVNNGTQAVTITGGEPFLHPNIEEFIEWILPNVAALAIISNGTLIPPSIMPILKKFSNKIVIQVSLNGNREYHDYFTGLKGSYDKAIYRIQKIINSGIKLRISMNVTEDNLKHIVSVAEIANNLNAYTLNLSPAHNIGREIRRREKSGYFKNKSTDTDLDFIKLFLTEVNRAKEKFPKMFDAHSSKDYRDVMSIGESDPITDIAQFPTTFHCGGGLKSIHIDSEGNVHACPIAKYCDFPSLGNVIDNSIEKVMSSDFSKHITNIYAPSPKHCGDCKEILFCGGCMARGYMRSLKLQKNCSWAKKLFYNNQ